MKRSELLRAIDDEFGARAATLTTDLVLGAFGRTAAEALDDGIDPRAVWDALCDETDVPEARRHGAGLIEVTRRRA